MGGPAQVFTTYHEKEIIHIRSHLYGEESTLTKNIIGYDANSLYIYCWGDVVPCGKDTFAVKEKPFDQKRITNFLKDVFKGEIFGFVQVIIDVLETLCDKFREIAPLLFKRYMIVIYLRKWRYIKKKTRKKKHLKEQISYHVLWKQKRSLFTPGICWYLQHRFEAYSSSSIGWIWTK